MEPLLDDELAEHNDINPQILEKYKKRHRTYAIFYFLINFIWGFWTSIDRRNIISEFLDKIIDQDWLISYLVICGFGLCLYFWSVLQPILAVLIVSAVSFGVTFFILFLTVAAFNLSPDSLPFLAALGGLIIIVISFILPTKYKTSYVKATR
ncbi:MAG: hypothetical protein GY810_06405 [Aureispira sp.]|nr:hypothetical protein [Aureispira sp.]